MIEVEQLTKTYGKLKAVDHIRLCAKPYEITVLLGPNGAGKSTTIKSITNLLKYEGTIRICGHANDSLEAKQSFGYIPETPMLYDLLTVKEHIDFISHAYNCKDNQQKIEEYLNLFELKEKLTTPAKELSKGMKQKLSMLLALIIEPKALLVDEPMVGLDPYSIEATLQLFEQLKQQGVAILISTHIIDVINEIWDEAYIMNKGQIIKHVSKAECETETLKNLFFEVTGE